MAGLTVYVGDSMSDLAPLLSADVGIVIGQNKLLRRVAKAAGIQLKPLVSGKALSWAPEIQPVSLIMSPVLHVRQTSCHLPLYGSAVS